MDLEEFKNFLTVLNDPNTETLELNITIDTLTLVFQNDLSSIEAQTFVAQVLNVQYGVFRYLSRLAQNRESPNEEIKKIFELLGYLVTNYASTVDQVAAQAIPWCLGMFHFESPIRLHAIKWMDLVVANCICLHVNFKNVVNSSKDFLNEKKLSYTLRQAMFSLLGTMCIRQELVMEPNCGWFINIISNAFREFTSAKNVSLILLEGCFQGLKGCLKLFALESAVKLNFYNYLKTFCEFSGQKHTLNRAALSVFIEHGKKFQDFLFNDRVLWEQLLNVWINFQSAENELLGFAAFETFYEVIGKSLVSRDAKQEFVEISQPLLLALQTPTGGKQNIQKVISAVANLREAFKKYSSESDLQIILNCLISLADTSNSDAKGLFHASCLTAISKILPCFQISEDIMFHTRIAVALVDNFPNIPVNFQTYSLQAIESTIIALSRLNPVDFQNYLELFFYQGLIRSSSHTLYVDAELLEENQKCVSYKSFLPFWIHVMTIYRRSGIGDEFYAANECVYHTFVNSFLEIISKLDLSITTGMEDRSDPSLALEASAPNDFHIFVNLVDLFGDVIVESDDFCIEKWFPIIHEWCINQCRARPLISGFFKILRIFFEAGQKLGCFTDSYDVETLVPFLEEVAARIDWIQGELEIACLKMILVAPARAIERILPHIDNVLQSAIRVGRGYQPMLSYTIAALDCWLMNLPLSSLEPILQKILPEFDVLLQSGGFISDGDSSVIFHAKLKSGGKFRKKFTGSTERQLVAIQKQFLVFLGKLPPGLCKFVIKPPESNAITEGSKLVYKLPLPDTRLNINLNPLLPRIIQLALSCGDRKTRVVACELLHAVVLLAIESTRRPDSNADVFEKLLSTALTLSCDSDKVVSDMFKPIMHQVAHYYSSKVHFKSTESEVLLKVFWNGATHPYNASVRDYSGDCIREFLVWCVKQSSDEIKISEINTVAVIRLICSYAVHPDRCKRLGAAIVFNNIYTVIREDKNILNSHWMQLFYSFVCCLRMCKDDEDARVLKIVLNRLKRPFLEMPHLFMEKSTTRRVPEQLREGLLRDVIEFTYKESQHSNKYLRELAQQFTKEIVGKYPGSTSLHQFLLLQRIEVKVSALPENTSVDFEPKVIAAMDFVNWLVDECSFDPSTILNDSELSTAAFQILKKLTKSTRVCQYTQLIVLKFAARVVRDFSDDSLRDLSKLLFKMKESRRDIANVSVILLEKISSTSLISWNFFLSILPNLSQKSVIASIKSKNVEFLRGLNILLSSNSIHLFWKLWSLELLTACSDVLFTRRGQKLFADDFQKPGLVNCLTELIPFFLKCNVSISDVMLVLTDATDVDKYRKKLKKGEYIFQNFKVPLVEFILESDTSVQTLIDYGAEGIKWILAILLEIQQGSYSAISKSFISELLIRWETIVQSPNANVEQLLLILKTVARVMPNSSGFLVNSRPSAWLFTIVRQRGYSPKDIRCALTFFELSSMFSTYAEVSNVDLETVLCDFRRYHREYFGDLKPVQQNDLPVALAMYSGLSRSLTLTGSLVVLQFLAKHVLKRCDAIDRAMVLFATSFTDDHVCKGLVKLFEAVLPFSLLEEDLKNLNDWMTTILIHASSKVVFDFFVHVLPQLYATIQEQYKGNSSAEELVLRKMSAVSLLQVFYLKTSQEQRIEVENTLVRNSSSCQGLFKTMISICSKTIVINGKPTPTFKRLSRLVNCECVKLMCTVAGQFSVEQPYKVFIFNNFLKRNIIDLEKEFSIGMDFERLPQIKKLLTTIRQDIRQVANPSLDYAHSITIFNSSLGEDVRKFDFSDLTVEQCVTDIVPIELEMDDINKHEVVPAICGVIHNMEQKGVPTNGALPCWLQYFMDTFSDPSAPKNSKIFALKLCHNLDSLLFQYSETCSPVLLKTVVVLFDTVNYLVTDVVAMVLSWKPKLEGFGSTIYEIIELFVNKSVYKRKDIVRSCLNYVKGVVECWKDNLNASLLVKLLLNGINDSSELAQYKSLMFASTLFGNKLVPNDVSMIEGISTWLLKTIETDPKNRDLAAEVLGQLFNNFPETYKKYEKNVQTMQVNTLYAVFKFFPCFVSEMIGSFISSAWQGAPELKRQSLEMLNSHFTRNPGEISEEALLRALIIDTLKSPVVALQEEALKLAFCLVPSFLDESLSSIIPQVSKLSDLPYAKIRCLVFDVLVAVATRYSDYNIRFPGIKLELLKKLKDGDEDVQEKALEYWFGARKRGEPSFKYFLWILDQLYEPNIESDFVEYACRLFLRSTSVSSDFGLDIFDHPLEKTTFTEYQILASYRAKHLSLAPMFAPSVATELTQMSVIKSSQSFRQQQIRATAQSLLFAPTQADVPDSQSQALSQQPVMDGVFKRPTTSFRHLRSASSISSQFAKRAVAKKVREESEAVERVKRRDGSVQLYRSYRIGDFPDIQIKHSSLITTLAVLISKDSQVAKDVFSMLFSAILTEVGDTEWKSFWLEASKAVSSMLQLSPFSDSIFLSSIFQLSLSAKLSVDSELICQAAKSSGLLSVGVLLIENNISGRDVKESSAKRKRGPESDEDKDWLFLGQLFQACGDVDGLRGVFLDKLVVEGAEASAIHEEANLNWLAVKRRYDIVLKENTLSDERLHFYSQAYYHCQAHLSNWQGMAESIQQTLSGNLDTLLDDAWHKDVMLPLYIRAKMMTALEGAEEEYRKFILEPKYANELNKKFACEVAVGKWLDSNTLEVPYFLHEAYKMFLKEWSHINEWDSPLKLLCLKRLTILSEMERVMSTPEVLFQERVIVNLVKTWDISQPSIADDLVDWDVRLSIRGKLVSKIHAFENMGEALCEYIDKSILECRFAMVKTAVDSSKDCTASKYLKITRGQLVDEDFRSTWRYYVDLMKLLEVRRSDSEADEKLAKYVQVWCDIEEKQSHNINTHKLTTLSLYRVVSEILHLAGKNFNAEKFPEDKRDYKTRWLDLATSCLALYGDQQKWAKQKGETYVQVAKFLRCNGGTWSQISRSILKGMATGNSEARHLFGCLLTTDVASDDVFAAVNLVPTWMFLLWRDQLLAALTQSHAFPEKDAFVKNILSKLAKEFPNSLSHGLRVSMENYSDQVINDTFVKELVSRVLSEPKEQFFVNAIANIADPYLKFLYYLEKALLKVSKDCDPDEVKKEIASLKNIINDPDHGDHYKDLQKFSSDLENAIILNFDLLEDFLKELKGKLQKFTRFRKMSPRLKMYSKFLAEYQGIDAVVEVPGQYDVDFEPRVANHVKIAGISQELTPLSSKRRPFKLVILGDDAMEYPFLVKFGEDLRQDERIQQVFTVMTSSIRQIANSDKLVLERYSVVPFSCCHGLVAWVNDTQSLNSLIFHSNDEIAKAQEEHLKFLSGGQQCSAISAHITGYMREAELDIVGRYKSLVSQFHPDRLRQAIWSLSASAEQFVYLRSNFAYSLGVMNIAHWVLGVGDRHLENILMSTRTGRVVGIDFGLAFGFATQSLGVPELLPFRLTPHLVNVLAPLNESGWLKYAMINTLKALREDPSVILAVLEAFVHEPCLDWEEHAQKLSRDLSDEIETSVWVARQKIGDVEGKLTGANPVVSFESDLACGRRNHRAYSKFLKIVRGQEFLNTRAALPRDGLTIEEQVNCLIDLAMDPMVLGLTYVGWKPWI